MASRRDLANAIRALSMDAVQQANSGHPGAPMGMADIAEVLWNDYLSHNPADPTWVNRDRFVLSNGHGSMLLYSLLHLSVMICRLKRSKIFVNCILKHQATQNMVMRRVLRLLRAP
jgi:transketolase